MLAGTMMDVPLTIPWILEHAARSHASGRVVSRDSEGAFTRYTYAELARRVARLAHALVELGVRPGDRVASFAWNTHRHLELYYAVPSIGAVLHTVNIRLFPKQVCWVLQHACDKLLFVDASLAQAVFAAAAANEETVPPVVVMGTVDDAPAGALDYETLLADKPDTYPWPEIDERSAAILCYTSATTGDPKGVLFSHRSTVVHALAAGLSDALGIRQADIVMPVVPMFHVNAWGIPFVAPMVGATLVLCGAKLDSASLIDLIEQEGVSYAAGVPTVWIGVRDELGRRGTSLPSLRQVIVGGAAIPPRLFDDLEALGFEVVHAWGMTEMSPIGTVSRLHGDLRDAPPERRREARLKQGRFSPIVAWRLLDDDGREVAHDGVARGTLWVRGPAVTERYFGAAEESAAFTDGYFNTGDVCTADELGYIHIVDRTKDLIKSGGEWISSVDVENALMGHPDVKEAAVVGVAHPHWLERPVAVVVARDGGSLDENALRTWLSGRLAKWWVPDRVVFVDAIPRTGVGKFLKRELRERYAALLTTPPGS